MLCTPCKSIILKGIRIQKTEDHADVTLSGMPTGSSSKKKKRNSHKCNFIMTHIYRLTPLCCLQFSIQSENTENAIIKIRALGSSKGYYNGFGQNCVWGWSLFPQPPELGSVGVCTSHSGSCGHFACFAVRFFYWLSPKKYPFSNFIIFYFVIFSLSCLISFISYLKTKLQV